MDGKTGASEHRIHRPHLVLERSSPLDSITVPVEQTAGLRAMRWLSGLQPVGGPVRKE
jgi:hypothetical protein